MKAIAPNRLSMATAKATTVSAVRRLYWAQDAATKPPIAATGSRPVTIGPIGLGNSMRNVPTSFTARV